MKPYMVLSIGGSDTFSFIGFGGRVATARHYSNLNNSRQRNVEECDVIKL